MQKYIVFCFNYLRLSVDTRMSALVFVAIATNCLPVELNLNQTNPVCH